MKKREEKNEIIKKDEKKSNKVIAIIIVGIVAVIAIVSVVIFKLKTPSLEEQFNSSLTKMGEKFYTDFYYVEISKNKSATEVSDFLSKFHDVGIKVNLDNLSRYNDNANKDEIAKFKNSDGKACNITNTKAIIYPKSPYGKSDYTVKVELDCGFDTNK